jgi:hypothetical protein
MDPGPDIAARQLAAVADVLLPWLRKDADSDSPTLCALLDASDSHVFDIAASFATVAPSWATRSLRAATKLPPLLRCRTPPLWSATSFQRTLCLRSRRGTRWRRCRL